MHTGTNILKEVISLSLTLLLGVKQQHIVNPPVSGENVSLDTLANIGGESESEEMYKIHGEHAVC